MKLPNFSLLARGIKPISGLICKSILGVAYARLMPFAQNSPRLHRLIQSQIIASMIYTIARLEPVIEACEEYNNHETLKEYRAWAAPLFHPSPNRWTSSHLKQVERLIAIYHLFTQPPTPYSPDPEIHHLITTLDSISLLVDEPQDLNYDNALQRIRFDLGQGILVSSIVLNHEDRLYQLSQWPDLTHDICQKALTYATSFDQPQWFSWFLQRYPVEQAQAWAVECLQGYTIPNLFKWAEQLHDHGVNFQSIHFEDWEEAAGLLIKIQTHLIEREQADLRQLISTTPSRTRTRF